MGAFPSRKEFDGQACRKTGQDTRCAPAAKSFSSQKFTFGVFYNDVFFLDKNEGWACGGWTASATAHTSDGGKTWQSQTTPSGTANLRAVFFLNKNQGWAVGGKGEILSTTNGGNSWSKKITPFSDGLQDIIFTDAQHGWAVGHDPSGADKGVIIATTDGGANWFSQSTSTFFQTVLAVHFTDPKNGWVAGHGGTLLQTTDGGNNWARLPSAVGGRLWSVHFPTPGTGWVAGESGSILKYSTGLVPAVEPVLAATAAAHEFSIAPNPCSDGSARLVFSDENFCEKWTGDAPELLVWNAAGRFFSKIVVQKDTPLDLSALPAGVYFFQIFWENGCRSAPLKFLKM